MTTVDWASLTPSQVRLRFFCLDCQADTHPEGIRETYAVQEWIWKQAVGSPDAGMLCIGCLEKRLHRKLISADFIDAPINIEERVSPRLLRRRTDGMTDHLRALRVLIRAVERDEYVPEVLAAVKKRA